MLNSTLFEPYAPNTYVFGVTYTRTNSSTVNNCTFNISGLSPTYGIADYESAGGNSYNNNTFVDITIPLFVQGPNQGTLTLNHCQFDEPPAN